MSGVYNRKLFRKSSARDELRRMGGIMASSEELLQEAMRTADQAPRPSGLGPMPMPQQAPMMAPPAMAPAMAVPMMGQPMMPQPMGQPMMGQPMMPQPMGQPMMAPPMQPMMQQPAFMPPQVPQSMQMAPAVPGYFLGGLINVAPAMGSGGESPAAPATPAPRPNPGRAAGIATPKLPSIDVSRTAGSAPNVSVDPELLDTAKALEMRLEADPPHVVANRILAEARARGAETTSDKAPPEQADEAMRIDLAAILESMTGDPAAYEKNIDQLNRGIIGAAIAAGTSARATENIAKGMLVGMESVKATEERRAADARALQLKALEVRAAEQAAREAEIKAGEKAKTEAKIKLAEDIRSAYSRARDSIIESGINNVGKLPEGMTLTQYAESFGRAQAEATYGKDAVDAILGTVAAPQSTLSAEDKAELLNEAKAKIGKNPALRTAVRDRLSKDFGITPEELDAVLGGS